MRVKNLLGAVAACGLLAGAAHAQSTAPSGATPDTTAGASGSMTSSGSTTTGQTTTGQPSAGMSTSGSTTSGAVNDTTAGAAGSVTTPGVSANSATSYASGASVTTTTLTNGPVPDTPENRQKYGQPMSRAGKHSAAKGN